MVAITDSVMDSICLVMLFCRAFFELIWEMTPEQKSPVTTRKSTGMTIFCLKVKFTDGLL